MRRTANYWSSILQMWLEWFIRQCPSDKLMCDQQWVVVRVFIPLRNSVSVSSNAGVSRSNGNGGFVRFHGTSNLAGRFLPHRRAKFQNRNRGRASQLKRRPQDALTLRPILRRARHAFVVRLRASGGSLHRSEKPAAQEVARHPGVNNPSLIVPLWRG